MTVRQVVPAWARDFNNKRRHCWPNREGVRILDDWAKKVRDYSPEPQVCTEDHDPKLTGIVEWLRFVRLFGKVADAAGFVNPFTAANRRHFLLNEVDGHTTSDGRQTYCETYLRSNAMDDADLWGLSPVFRVFLDNESGWARIECYDGDLVGLCEQALGEVERSYGELVTR